MKTAVIYARYSSDKQTEQSIEGQVRVCNEYARKHDIVIVDQYVDRAMTGTNDRREEFQRMIKDSAKAKWDYVLVYKLDRFSRDKYESAIHRRTLRNNGVKLLSAMENIPDSPEGIILESLLEGMNQYFSAELSQKVKRGMRESREKGNYTGGPVAFGYKVKDKKIYIDEDEATVVRYMFSEYAQGKFMTDIMEELNNRGIRNRGNLFVKSSIHNMLRNRKYRGEVNCCGETYTNIYPQIVPTDIFDFVQAKLRKNHNGRHDSSIVYLLKEKLICGYCGRPVHSSSGKSTSGNVFRYYRCAGRTSKFGENSCMLRPIRQEPLEEIVVQVVVEVLGTELIDRIVDKIMERYLAIKDDCSMLNSLKNELNSVENAISNIVSAFEKGLITKSTKERLEELEKRKEELDEQIICEEAKNGFVITRNDIKKFFFKAIKKEPQQIVDTLVDKVLIYDDRLEIFLRYEGEFYFEEEVEKETIYHTQKHYIVDTKKYNSSVETRSLNVDVCA